MVLILEIARNLLGTGPHMKHSQQREREGAMERSAKSTLLKWSLICTNSLLTAAYDWDGHLTGSRTVAMQSVCFAPTPRCIPLPDMRQGGQQ